MLTLLHRILTKVSLNTAGKSLAICLLSSVVSLVCYIFLESKEATNECSCNPVWQHRYQSHLQQHPYRMVQCTIPPYEERQDPLGYNRSNLLGHRVCPSSLDSRLLRSHLSHSSSLSLALRIHLPTSTCIRILHPEERHVAW